MKNKLAILAFAGFLTVNAVQPLYLVANSCGPPKRISVHRACGLALDPNGTPITGLEVGLALSSGEVVETTTTDANGSFDFSTAKPGSYILYSKSDIWDVIGGQ